MIETLTSRTQAQLGQILLCRGCCCGQTERGMPDVPVERIKAVWKAEKLNRSIQLTLSGCLGPCDVPNVVLVLTPNGADWFANVSGDFLYETLVDWARTCHREGRLSPFPAVFNDYRLPRFGRDTI